MDYCMVIWQPHHIVAKSHEVSAHTSATCYA